jgi:CRP/FNR family cyclic AMP-dependent transcriptional regulator
MYTTIEKVIFLQSVDVFSRVPTGQLAALAAIAEEIRIMKNEVVYRENDAPDALYLVLEGEVKLHRDDREIAVAGAEEAFGAWALFDDEPRVVQATALTDMRLLRIDKDDFYDLLADNIEVTQSILKSMVKRLRALAESVGVEHNFKKREE